MEKLKLTTHEMRRYVGQLERDGHPRTTLMDQIKMFADLIDGLIDQDTVQRKRVRQIEAELPAATEQQRIELESERTTILRLMGLAR